MTHSSKRPRSPKTGKPAKPRPDFPLFVHGTGYKRWAKKVRGKLRYFGPVTAGGDHGAETALALWVDQREDLLAGREPRPHSEGVLILAELCNRVQNAKRVKQEAGELSERSFAAYYRAGVLLVEQFGGNRPVEDFGPDDFDQLFAHLAKTQAAASRTTTFGWVRAIFRHAAKQGWIDRPVNFGSAFEGRKGRGQSRPTGARMFSPAELRAMMDAARPDVRAWILLGLNCAFGGSDLATLRRNALDLNRGWIEHPRPKTGAFRRCPLWPETIDALKAALASRPEPAVPEYAPLVFLTSRGTPLIHIGRNGRSWTDAVTNTFDRLLKRLEMKTPGRNAYALRHVFRTVADATCDFPAVNLVMGHLDGSTGGRFYRERIADGRLVKVAECVRTWLFSPDPAAGDDEEPATVLFRQKIG